MVDGIWLRLAVALEALGERDGAAQAFRSAQARAGRAGRDTASAVSTVAECIGSSSFAPSLISASPEYPPHNLMAAIGADVCEIIDANLGAMRQGTVSNPLTKAIWEAQGLVRGEEAKIRRAAYYRDALIDDGQPNSDIDFRLGDIRALPAFDEGFVVSWWTTGEKFEGKEVYQTICFGGGLLLCRRSFKREPQELDVCEVLDHAMIRPLQGAPHRPARILLAHRIGEPVWRDVCAQMMLRGVHHVFLESSEEAEASAAKHGTCADGYNGCLFRESSEEAEASAAKHGTCADGYNGCLFRESSEEAEASAAKHGTRADGRNG